MWYNYVEFVREIKGDINMARELIEYNSEKLTLGAIADKEGLAPNTLKKYYIQIGDIYKAIEVCKEISRGKRGKVEKIEYNGQQLTITAIAKKENVAWTTLKRYYTQTKNIYDAVALAKENSIGKVEKVEYNGKQLSIRAIAQMEGIDQISLRKHYRETGDIYKSVQICKQNSRGKRKKIEYKGAQLELAIIAKIEGIAYVTLKKYYLETGDVYEAIKLSKLHMIKKIDYKGEQLTITTIAEREGINVPLLKTYYAQTKDIYRAVKLSKENMRGKIRKIEYNGEQLTIAKIAKKESLNVNTLRSHYQKVYDIYEAVKSARKTSRKIGLIETNLVEVDDGDRDIFMEQRKRQKSQNIKMGKAEISLYDMSLIIGIQFTDLINLIGKGITIDEIKEKYADRQRRVVKSRDVRELEDGQQLLNGCAIYGFSYSYMYIGINEYGKTIEQVIESYKKNENKIPLQWIGEQYGALLRHLETNDDIDLQEIVEYFKTGELLIQDVLEKYIIRRNAKASEINEEWLEELYSLMTTDILDAEEKEDYKAKLHINSREMQYIEETKIQISRVNRKLQLYEIYKAIQNRYYEEDEIPQLLQEFEVTLEEMDTVFIDLLFRYNESLFEEQAQLHRTDIIKKLSKKWDYLSGIQRNEALKENNISTLERVRIENISRRITRFKRMLNYQTQEQPIQ